ncbi:hypothetical protein FOCG_18441, partial [Fusarium oxysporum f. sp. radicis-lycopersici 26381]
FHRRPRETSKEKYPPGYDSSTLHIDCYLPIYIFREWPVIVALNVPATGLALAPVPKAARAKHVE